MKFCKFIVTQIEEKTWRHVCQQCGRDITIPIPAMRMKCHALDPSVPATVMRFAGEIGKWVAGGFKTREPAEAERILAICDGCDHLNKATKYCQICGCHMPSKIKMETTKCPLDQPLW